MTIILEVLINCYLTKEWHNICNQLTKILFSAGESNLSGQIWKIQWCFCCSLTRCSCRQCSWMLMDLVSGLVFFLFLWHNFGVEILFTIEWFTCIFEWFTCILEWFTYILSRIKSFMASFCHLKKKILIGFVFIKPPLIVW